MKKEMHEVLKDSWSDVENYYKSNSISSERSLQAILFESIRRHNTSKGDKVLVEPSIDSYVPDIVVVGQDNVRCIMEIKCAPHWWVTGPGLKKDLTKLVDYSRKSSIDLHLFGHDMIFDPWKKTWLTPSKEYVINDETLFCFAVISLKNETLASPERLQKYVPELQSIKFCLLSGVINVDVNRRCSTSKFIVQ